MTCGHTHHADWCPLADSDLEVEDLTTREIVTATLFSRLHDADCVRCAAFSMLKNLEAEEDRYEAGFFLALAEEVGTDDVLMIGEVWETTLSELFEIICSTKHTCRGGAE